MKSESKTKSEARDRPQALQWLTLRSSGARLSFRKREQMYAAAFLAPAVLILCAVVLYPILQNIWLSFHDKNLLNPAAGTPFVGFANFNELLGSGRFWQSSLNTVVLTGLSVGIQVIVGLALALLLNAGLRLQTLFRALFILPWATPTFVAAFLWIWLLHGQYGAFNITLETAGLISEGVPWFAQPSTAMLGVVFAYVWKGLPWVILVLLAGLQAIDPELLQAARVDGANVWREFLHVILPGLRNVLLIVIVLRTIWTFNWFDYIFLLTGGGPLRSTHVLPIEVYQEAFVAFRFGRAAAVGVLMFAVLMVFTVLYFRILAKEERL